MIHGRLIAAVRRHGLASVISLVVSALFRYGLVATVRLGSAERPFPRGKAIQAYTAPANLDELVAAVRRDGLASGISSGLSALLRYGLAATVRLGSADRPFPRGEAIQAYTGGPADLDEAWTLDSTVWDSWRSVIGSGAPAGASNEPAANLVFVLLGETSNPQALERTRAAVAALASYASLWSPDNPPQTGSMTSNLWWVFLRPGDLPSPEMPRALAQASRGGVAEVISFDLVRRDGDRIQPLLLPGANPTLLQAVDYMFSRVAVADGLVQDAADLGASDPRALILQWMRGRSAPQVRGRWRHVCRPLIEAAISAEDIQAARRRVLANNHLPVRPYVGQPITVVICTRDRGHLTRQLVRGLLALNPALMGEVVIVSNNTANPYALATLADLGRESRVQVLREDAPFNFSKLCNAGARGARGRGPLLFLNDDIMPVSEDWLQRLGGRLENPDVGSAGPLLLYPDERVQHAGTYLGHRGIAGHVLRTARLPEGDYLFTGCAPREVSSLTGAALITPRPAFEALGGFDEQLATQLQDVDYCLRLKGIGLLNVFEPASVLIHMESASIRSFDSGGEFQRKRSAERMRFVQRWGADVLKADPLHSRGFDVEDETLHRLSGPNGLRPKLTKRT